MFDSAHNSLQDDDNEALNDERKRDERKLNDIVEKMCSSSTAEEREHLASQLRGVVDCITNIGELSVDSWHVSDHAAERGPAVTALNRRLQGLLISNEQAHRLAAIAAFTALINTESESIQARAQRAANAVRVLFGTPVTDIATAKAAARMVGALSNVNSPLSARAVDHVLKNAINLIGNPKYEELNPQVSYDRARSAMVIAELAGVDKVPKFVFRFQDKLGTTLWYVVWDKQRFVRDQGVLALQAILKTVIIRGTKAVTDKAMTRALETVRLILSSDSTGCSSDGGPQDDGQESRNMAVVHGTLSIVASLLSADETAPFLLPVAPELCTLAIRFQKSSDPLVREAVAEVLPLLVRLDGSIFEGSFLNQVHESTLELVNNRRFPAEERGRSLVSLAATAEQIPSDYHGSLLEDMLLLCQQSLSAHRKPNDGNLIPRPAVLRTISHLARASRGNVVFERYMREGILSLMFSTDFTNTLVEAISDVGAEAPGLSGFIQGRLVNLIAATLRSKMRDEDVALMPYVRPGQDQESRFGNRRLVRQLSTPALNGSGCPTTNGADDRSVWNNHIGRSPCRSSRSLDFFKQYPFSSELQRIDSGAAIASDSTSCVLEELVRSLNGSEATSPSSSNDLQSLPFVDDDPMIDKENSPCVALKAIVKFDFTGLKAQDFTSFANEFVIGYVESQVVKVRALTIVASAKLMESAAMVWSEMGKNGTSHQKLRPEIQAILAQLLLLCVGDPSKDVRFVAIQALNRQVFYSYLLQPEMLSTLFMCFHDESLAIRNSALSLTGRLSDRNPAHILPALRKYLLYLLTALRFDGDFFERDRWDATMLIYTLVRTSGTLVEPYTNALMDGLLIRLQEAKQKNDTSSALPVLLTIAEMGGVMNRIDLKPYRAALVPLIVSSVLQVQSAELVVRKAALRALAAIVQNTGYVIQPYIEHKDLLPGLLELLRVEKDSSVRLEAETLIGCLGAVDPNNHKYAAIPMYIGRRSASKILGSGSQSRSLFRFEIQSIQPVSYRGGSGSRLLPHGRGSGQRMSGLLNGNRQRQPQVSLDARGTEDSRDREGRILGSTSRLSHRDVLLSGLDWARKVEDVDNCISIFAIGGARLSMIVGDTPVWNKRDTERGSLVFELDHPFTASPNFFPSAALDHLVNIIRNPRLRSHHRDACQAIVNVLKSVGPKCSFFLPAVVPRVLWLLGQPSYHETSQTLTFSRLQQHVMLRLGDIIFTAGHAYLPHAFDTVLLTWYYLKNFQNSPACIASTCGLLSRLRNAIGDEFKPIIATVLPLLLASLSLDRSPKGTAARAVLRLLKSFSPLYDEYSTSVLVCLTRVISTERQPGIRQEALITLIVLLEEMPHVDVLSYMIHTLIQILTGLKHQTASSEEKQNDAMMQSIHDRHGESAEDGKLAVLAATALLEIGIRATHGFDVFVPIIAKALKYGRAPLYNKKVCDFLEKVLMRRSPDVVSEILCRSVNEVEKHRSCPNLKDIEESQLKKIVQELRREGTLDVQAVLPRGRNISGVIVGEENLMQNWVVDHSFTADDWVRWIADLGAVMFEESGAPAFRACVRISESYPQFTNQLFNAAFLSCWVYPLSQDAKSKICGTLEQALVSETIPLNVLQSLLNLFEFMDHDEKPLPAGTERLAWTACKCGALAKAVRYREQDYAQHFGKPEKLEQDINGEDGLIAIYEKLGHIESAVGTITHYQNQTGEKVKEKWFEKLQRWDDALEVYENESINFTEGLTTDIYSNKNGWQNTLGRLRCLNEIGEWHKMNDLLLDSKKACEGNVQALRELAVQGKGVSVTLDLGRWEEFEEWVGYLDPSTFDGCFYKTILMVKQGKEDSSRLDDAEDFLQQAREKLDLELTARVSEGYPRAYGKVVEAQILVELEEMISFLRMHEEETLFGMQRLRSLWNDRLRGCQRERYTWYRILMIRSLVMTPIEDKDNWLSFAKLCRKTDRLPMASHTLNMLYTSFTESSSSLQSFGNGLHTSTADAATNLEEWDVESVAAIKHLELKFACVKHIWALNRKVDAYSALESCKHEYLRDTRMGIAEHHHYASESKRVLAGEVFLKLSKWGGRLIASGAVQEEEITDPLVYADEATKISPRWYKAWHYWAQHNVARFEAKVGGKNRSIGPRVRSGVGPTYQPNLGGTHLEPREKNYIMHAVRGYFRAIDLAGKSSLEDSLKLLTLWFNYGGLCGLHEEFDRGFRETNIAQWLEVVPQIIARLYTPFEEVQRGVRTLLTRIGTEHPHVAVYPLTVAKSTAASHQQKRSKAAHGILQELKHHHEEIVKQAELVSTELVRVAVLWTETWYESLDEASRMYFVNHNIEEMLDSLLPLHKELEQGGDTPFEQNFKAEFGAELREAGQLCEKFRVDHRDGVASGDTLRQYLNQAWGLYHHVFQRIQRQQQGMHVLDLAHVSNGLHDATGLLLAVPGTYHPDENVPVVGIQSFVPELSVIQSKQRPRKLTIIGSDGRKYLFLLKGHEDLRQDERVMQVLGLMNKLFLKSTQRSILQDVGLKTYSVIALSANAGLIEWVPGCDTMHTLVKEYREVRKIMPNIERRVMLRIAPEPDRLSLLHKVDLFEFMLQNTGGVDIAKVLWLKSRNSEMWLDRRTTYAKSLATTSMTGYLLGLGDRHPSNLMIERSTGKIMHIDYGDCFEVAMNRDKYPEKVPFRLTRMLVEALEPCGVDGYFRHTSEATLYVLRQPDARESLLSMMEAFVYDPLIRWKLIGTERLEQIRQEQAANQGVHQGGLTVAEAGDIVGEPTAAESDIVRSLRQTGSLSASMRVLYTRQSRQAGIPGPTPPGAIPTPANTAQLQVAPNQQEEDAVNVRTPSEQARLEVQKFLREQVEPVHNRLTDVSNEKARAVLSRFADKLCGTDYDPEVVLTVPEQVGRLLRDAQNVENLCQLFLGWCAFW